MKKETSRKQKTRNGEGNKEKKETGTGEELTEEENEEEAGEKTHQGLVD